MPVHLAGFLTQLIGMRNEPSHDELSSMAPSLLAALTRALGVSVRKPRRASHNPNADTPREPWFAGAGYWPDNHNDEGR